MKRRVSKLLILALVFTMLTPIFALAETSTTKEDLGDYASAVNRLAGLGVLTGDEKGNFNVDDTITRAEFAAMSVRLLGLDEAAKISGGQTSFKDSVAPWAQGYVNVATQQGLLNGYTDGTFRENNPVTQAEALAILIRALGYDSQVAKTGWPTNYVVKGVELGLTEGVDNVSANEPAKRGDIFLFADNALTVNKLVQTQFGDTPRYEVSDKTLLSDNLGIDKVTAVVTDIPRTDSKLDDEIKIGKDVYTVGEGFDFETVLGAEVTAYVDGDKVIDIVVNDEFLFDAIKVDDEVITLVAADDEYELNKNATIFANGSEVDADELASTYDYAKLIVNDDDEVLFLEAFDFDALVVEKEKDGIVSSYGEELDVEDFTIVKAGKTIASDAIKAGDILFYNDDAGYAEVYTNSVTGEIEKIYDDAFIVDGEKLATGGVYLSGGALEGLTTDALEAMEAEGEVEVFLDRAGNVVFVAGDLGEAATTTVAIWLDADAKAYEYRTSKYLAVDAVNENGEEVSYDFGKSVLSESGYGINSSLEVVTLDANGNQTTTVVTTLVEGSIIELSVDEDGDVVSFAPVTQSTTLGATEDIGLTSKYAAGKKLSSSTVVFLYSEDLPDLVFEEVFTWADADEYLEEITDAVVFFDNNQNATYLLVDIADTDVNTDDKYQAFVLDVKKLASGKYETDVVINGKEYTFVLGDKLNEEAVYELFANEEMDEATVGSSVYDTDTFTVDKVNLASRTITGGTITYELVADAYIYNAVDNEEMSLRDIKNGDEVAVYNVFGAANRFIQFVVVDPNPAPVTTYSELKAGVTYTANVTAKNLFESTITFNKTTVADANGDLNPDPKDNPVLKVTDSTKLYVTTTTTTLYTGADVLTNVTVGDTLEFRFDAAGNLTIIVK